MQVCNFEMNKHYGIRLKESLEMEDPDLTEVYKYGEGNGKKEFVDLLTELDEDEK